jgi:hypothetical protein
MVIGSVEEEGMEEKGVKLRIMFPKEWTKRSKIITCKKPADKQA